MIDRPIVILGAPRSGTTILQRCLALHPDLWHLVGESHTVLEGPFHPAQWGYISNRVTADQCDDEVLQRLRSQFYRFSINLNVVVRNPSACLRGSALVDRLFTKLSLWSMGHLSRVSKPESIRMLEKTPKNTLRVPMLERLFPDAYYIWIKRRAEANIDSLIAGWYASDRVGPITRQRYAAAGYPVARVLALKDYSHPQWKFALVPGWRELREKSVADVAAWQYYQCNYHVLTDLANLNSSRVFSFQYEEFIEQPVEKLRSILEWAKLSASGAVEYFAQVLPRVNATARNYNQDEGSLRYPEAVHSAIERLPKIQQLQSQMGYGNALSHDEGFVNG